MKPFLERVAGCIVRQIPTAPPSFWAGFRLRVEADNFTLRQAIEAHFPQHDTESHIRNIAKSMGIPDDVELAVLARLEAAGELRFAGELERAA